MKRNPFYKLADSSSPIFHNLTLLLKDLIPVKCNYSLVEVPHQLFIPQSKKIIETGFAKGNNGGIQGS